MFFHFPHFDVLRIALQSGMIPPSVAEQPARVQFADDGSVAIAATIAVPRPMAVALKRMGIAATSSFSDEPVPVGSWLEILPLIKQEPVPELTSSTEVLFELPAELLGEYVREMLRLGNDRQSFHPLSDGKSSTVLLRVLGPPYYTLLRVLDQLDEQVTAYVQHAPRIWVELGYVHPLVGQLKPSEGQSLLLRSPRSWTTLADTPFCDIYENLDFRLTRPTVTWPSGEPAKRFTVSLRLADGNAADTPELWVLDADALATFDLFVRDADARLAGQLLFAVAEHADKPPTIVARVRQHARAVPLGIDLPGAIGFVRYRRLPNLYLPAGSRLQPTLRRDAVRELLAADDSRIVWLSPLDDGRFVPHSLADEAFRPLSDWVDYIIDREREPLESWITSVTFDFDSFVCAGSAPIPIAPETKRGSKPKIPRPVLPSPEPPSQTAVAEPRSAKKSSPVRPEEDAIAVVVQPAPLSELAKQRETLERAFLDHEGPLESAERQSLWPQLARVNGALEDHPEAAVCWANALWERDDLPAAWLSVWFHSEAKGASAEVTDAEIERELAQTTPSNADLRRLAARLLHASARQSVSPVLLKRLPEIRQYLERHDENLGVRTTWMVWRQLALISKDVLGLARVRDRLIARLFRDGLKRVYDVPNFIHFAGQRDSARLRQTQDALLRLRNEVQAWLALDKSLQSTASYADLLFAYGFAKLGEERQRTELATAALTTLRAGDNRVPQFLADVFELRIQEAIQGKEGGHLPVQILKQLDGMEPVPVYAINRLRKHLQVLEPHERTDPLLLQKTQPNRPVMRRLATLALQTDPKRLQTEIRRILGEVADSPASNDRLIALIELLPLTMRVGKEFADELLGLALPLITIATAPAKQKSTTFKDVELQARLIEVAVPLAANFDWGERVQQLLHRFIDQLRTLDESEVIASMNLAIGRWQQSLRRCGLREQLQSLLEELSELLMKGRTLEQLRREYNRESKRKDWANMLRALLHLAESWIYVGHSACGLPLVDEARLFLIEQKVTGERSPAHIYTPVICAYVRALGQIDDLDLIGERFRELVQKIDAIPNTHTTSEFYSDLHLTIIESMVLAVASADHILGETARRWLDDDEYLVRRRIHADMKNLLETSGI